MQIIRNRYRRDTRQLEEEEESWFNEEEDFSEELDSYSVMKSEYVLIFVVLLCKPFRSKLFLNEIGLSKRQN